LDGSTQSALQACLGPVSHFFVSNCLHKRIPHFCSIAKAGVAVSNDSSRVAEGDPHLRILRPCLGLAEEHEALRSQARKSVEEFLEMVQQKPVRGPGQLVSDENI